MTTSGPENRINVYISGNYRLGSRLIMVIKFIDFDFICVYSRMRVVSTKKQIAGPTRPTTQCLVLRITRMRIRSFYRKKGR